MWQIDIASRLAQTAVAMRLYHPKRRFGQVATLQPDCITDYKPTNHAKAGKLSYFR